MPDLTSLLERVRAASGPDRELDRDIWQALCWWESLRETPKRSPFTDSIDAAVALVEQMGFPIHTVHRNKVGVWAVTLFPDGEAEHALFPLAILAALLTAMQKD